MGRWQLRHAYSVAGLRRSGIRTTKRKRDVARFPVRVSRSLAEALAYNRHSSAPRVWWLDAGNGERFGQVLVGSSLSTDPKDYPLTELGYLNLPAPGVQAPALLMDKPEEMDSHHLACDQLALLNIQSLTVNAQAATLAADLALALVTGNLQRLAVYFDQTSGSMTSKYTTPTVITQASSVLCA